MRRGEVWWAEFDERRPVVLLSGEDPSGFRAMQVVAPADTDISGLGIEVAVGAKEGLPFDGVLRFALPHPGFTPCTWLTTLNREDLIERAGAVSAAKLSEIDDALRAAHARGVKIRLMVSNWNTEAPAIDYLKSLAVLPGVEVRIVTLPQASAGFIPYARVVHSKMMVVDGQVAWIGTSNWAGGYLDKSRNLELVVRDETFALRVRELHRQTWDSPYAAPIDIMRTYPRPVKAK